MEFRKSDKAAQGLARVEGEYISAEVVASCPSNLLACTDSDVPRGMSLGYSDSEVWTR